MERKEWSRSERGAMERKETEYRRREPEGNLQVRLATEREGKGWGGTKFYHLVRLFVMLGTLRNLQIKRHAIA